MHLFISAGEPSGDLHAANLIRALRRAHPGIEISGFGGERMAAAGCKLLYPLCQLAVMWVLRVLAKAPIFISLLSQADRFFRHRRPDAVILIDFPGFNWWIARRAHFHGIPVFYFVPPQLWAWFGWRVRKMQKWVDHVLCTLPFEEPWYRKRGVAAEYVGHPYFDELGRQQLDRDFLKRHRGLNGPIIGLLPGSRGQEVERNLSTLVRAAGYIHRERPDARFLVACYRDGHRRRFNRYLAAKPQLPIQVYAGRTPEIIELSHANIAVSGSVSLELLHRGKPTVTVYRTGWLDLKIARPFITAPYISLVNLLAGKELFPEYLTDHCESEAIAGHVLDWLNDSKTYDMLKGELEDLRRRFGQPGACERTARFILDRLTRARLAA